MLPSNSKPQAGGFNSNNSSDTDPNKKRLKLEQPGNNNNNKPFPGPSSSFLSGKKPSPINSNPGHHHMHHQQQGGGGGGGGTGHHYYHQPQNESKFYALTSIEVKDQMEITLEEAFNKLQYLISPVQSNQPDNILFNELSQYSNQSKVHSDEVSNALLYSILTDPANSSKSLRNLFLCNSLSFSFGAPNQTDAASASSYATMVNHLMMITSDYYPKLLDVTRKQLLWLLKELTKAKVSQVERLLLQMLRNIQSGCLTEKNVWLAETMLDIFCSSNGGGQGGNNSGGSASAGGPDQPSGAANLWICGYNELMLQTIYSYLRIIADHVPIPSLNSLKQRETDFCVQLLR